MSDGEDNVCVIDLATKAEVTAFIDSMKKSGYTQEGTLYSHQLNSNGQPPYVHVRVKGLRVIIITPFEMIPYGF